MRNIRVLLPLIASAALFSSPADAGSADTLFVRSAGTDALASAVMGDTLAGGARANPNRVYLLERGARYVNRRTIVSRGYRLRIAGQPAPVQGRDPGPAVMQLAPDTLRFLYNDRVTDQLILAEGDLTVSNIWFLSWVAAGAQLWEPITEGKDSARVCIDHCVFEWQEGPALHVAGRWATVVITNTMIRNAIYSDEWWAGRGVYFTSPADTLVEVNNTLENLGFGLIQTQGIGLNYYLCDHNTVVNCAKFCWLESYYTNAYIANNLLVNCHFTGERIADRRFQDPDTLLYGQTINVDTLKTPGRRITAEEAIRRFGSDAVQLVDQQTLDAGDPRELGRVIVYANNASYFDSSAFYGFYRRYNASVSAPAGRIQPEPVMNERTASMWAWHPRMINTGGIDDENPQFTFMPDTRALMAAFLGDMYSSSPKNNVFWGYDPDDTADSGAARNRTAVYRNSSRGVYPSREDFSFRNRKLLTAGLGGFPVGDLNWFPGRRAAWTLETDQALMSGALARKGNRR